MSIYTFNKPNADLKLIGDRIKSEMGLVVVASASDTSLNGWMEYDETSQVLTIGFYDADEPPNSSHPDTTFVMTSLTSDQEQQLADIVSGVNPVAGPDTESAIPYTVYCAICDEYYAVYGDDWPSVCPECGSSEITQKWHVEPMNCHIRSADDPSKCWTCFIDKEGAIIHAVEVYPNA